MSAIPGDVVKSIRILSLLVWVLVALVIAYYSWIWGRKASPYSGQEMQLTDIKERATREENLENPPGISVPNVNELLSEDDTPPPPVSHPIRNGLAGEGESTTEEGKKTLPPFLGEEDALVYPEREYIPERPPMPGTDEPSLLPVPDSDTQREKLPAAPVQSEPEAPVKVRSESAPSGSGGDKPIIKDRFGLPDMLETP